MIDMVPELLAEIEDGHTLLATREDGGDAYAVWIDYGERTSMAPYEGVTRAELDAVIAQHPDKVFVREQD